jgi:hypothetical protein
VLFQGFAVVSLFRKLPTQDPDRWIWPGIVTHEAEESRVQVLHPVAMKERVSAFDCLAHRLCKSNVASGDGIEQQRA